MLALACAANRAGPGAGPDHDRGNSSSFSMHRLMSSGGNGAAAAAAAAVIAHAKINRSSGGKSAGGSNSSSSSTGGPSSGQQKRPRDIARVSGGGRGQTAPPGTRSGGGPWQYFEVSAL